MYPDVAEKILHSGYAYQCHEFKELPTDSFTSAPQNSLTTNQKPSHANAHDAKLVPLFLTQLRSQDPIDPSKSQTISPASLQISSIT